MTSKEKAKELVERFGRVNKRYNTDDLLFSERIIGKECALICVNEITEALRYVLDFSSGESFLYWKDVKNEIEKL